MLSVATLTSFVNSLVMPAYSGVVDPSDGSILELSELFAGRGDGVADPNAAGRARMKAIVTRRKLLDLARAQTDEIEFLRQELDRLRQKTFPSFATRRNPNVNPDDAEQY